MSTKKSRSNVPAQPEAPPPPIPFPLRPQPFAQMAAARQRLSAEGLEGSHDDVLAAFESMSRRINDLARELKCLGYFDDELDRGPRAA